MRTGALPRFSRYDDRCNEAMKGRRVEYRITAEERIPNSGEDRTPATSLILLVVAMRLCALYMHWDLSKHADLSVKSTGRKY